MVAFTVPASKASIRQNMIELGLPAEFDEDGVPVPGCEVLTAWVPKFQYLPMEKALTLKRASDALRDAKALDEAAPVDEIMATVEAARALVDEYMPGWNERLSSDQVLALLTGWTEASSISVGESSASAN